MPPTVIARVNLFGKNEPSILTFTDWHGREIGDHPQDVEPSGNDDDSVVNLILDVIPGVDPTPDEDAELPGVDTDFDAEPTRVEVDSDYVVGVYMQAMIIRSLWYRADGPLLEPYGTVRTDHY
jgi:hypothetical protein